ncbi:ATP-binding protein [Rhodocytophaga aerolata]|uniref:histidine kinase n=1 Tax=Rhodocytophaga aerolata TaxID=455078 RepID=A0ABT8R727_9BACT|nr:GAF domain-containing hybrid sensor histidine kinase/response regulator [Rhodocytophaga aerolata]MDO1447906.1 ATP-binding protein [Rhodocytophaga aerolata]
MNNDIKNELPIPENEQERLEALNIYSILDTLPEEEYDAITKLASYICQVPIALISLIDRNRQWFKSRVGMEVPESPRSISFCQYAIMGSDILEIPDLQQDKRFATNPSVTTYPHIRFYAGAPLITPDGYALGTLCILDTKPHTLHAEQRNALQTLAKSVVTQLVLREQKKKLEEEKEKALQSARVKEQFLANMSHEIRTPLNGIMGLTNLLLASQLSGEQHTFLTYIKSSADNLLGIVNDILDYSKIESGSMALQAVPFSLQQLFKRVIELFSAKADQKGLQLIASYADEIPDTLIGDPVRLQQVLSNIIDNAVKFTESGKITVSVDKHSQDEQQITLLFTVQDTGIGIAEDKVKDIFESFTQADNKNNRRYGGTGLGLAIAKRLVEAQGGKIWLSSQPGKGTNCQLLLSFPMGTHSEHRATSQSQQTEKIIRVLVAEDNEVNQLIIGKVLRDGKFRLTFATNGGQVLEQLSQQAFDIILMDIQMPGMDGFEAIKRIRNSTEAYHSIPIVALTAHVQKEEIQEYIVAGANDCLPKPFQPDVLISRIEQLTSQQ